MDGYWMDTWINGYCMVTALIASEWLDGHWMDGDSSPVHGDEQELVVGPGEPPELGQPDGVGVRGDEGAARGSLRGGGCHGVGARSCRPSTLLCDATQCRQLCGRS